MPCVWLVVDEALFKTAVSVVVGDAFEERERIAGGWPCVKQTR